MNELHILWLASEVKPPRTIPIAMEGFTLFLWRTLTEKLSLSKLMQWRRSWKKKLDENKSNSIKKISLIYPRKLFKKQQDLYPVNILIC